MNENVNAKTYTFNQACPECGDLYTNDGIECVDCYVELVAIEPVTKTYNV